MAQYKDQIKEIRMIDRDLYDGQRDDDALYEYRVQRNL